VRRWKFWDESASNRETAASETAQTGSLPGRTAHAGDPAPRPSASPPQMPTHSEAQQRLASLKRRRDGILFDVEQAELALTPDNPWRERMALLGETLKVVENDIAALDNEPRVLRPPLPPTPIVISEVTPDDPAKIVFTVGSTEFRYESDLDWAEKGTTIARGDLLRTQGDPAAIVPDEIPVELRDELASHLDNSLSIFATDLRHRADERQPMPESPALADFAQPCPVCGHWQSWGGFCATCADRANRRRALEAEFMRISAEQAAEEEERAKWAERLPTALRRLKDVEGEIAALSQL
jgi:hypothetical protein